MTAEGVPQEQNHVNFELRVDNYDRNHEEQNAADADSKGKIRRRRRPCGEI